DGGRGAKVSQPSRATDKIGDFAGISGRTIEKIRAVCDAAGQDPAKFGKLRDDMDRTRRVDGAYKRLRVLQQEAAVRAEPPALPGSGPYRVIVADPPWKYDARSEDLSQKGNCPYPAMSTEDICVLDVSHLTHEDCILWLWTTNSHLPDAFKVLAAWGFR